jgi:hypothetical protein
VLAERELGDAGDVEARHHDLVDHRVERSLVLAVLRGVLLEVDEKLFDGALEGDFGRLVGWCWHQR